MFFLMFGIGLKQDWIVAGDQLLYALVLAILLFARIPYDHHLAPTLPPPAFS